MNKRAIREERMQQILKLADTGSPLGILRRLRELDQEES